MCVKIVIVKYTLTFSMLAGVVVVLEVVLGVLGISKRVGGVVERMLLRLRVLLQVGVLGRGEVSKKKVVWV